MKLKNGFAIGKYGIYFQPNKHSDGDCVIRAICKAADMEWSSAYEYAYMHTKNKQYVFDSLHGIKIILNNLGFISYKEESHWNDSLQRRTKRTVNDFCKENPKGTFVLNLAGHIVTVVDGKFYDIWDCGHSKIYSYFKKI